jgi:hypothetical protein
MQFTNDTQNDLSLSMLEGGTYIPFDRNVQISNVMQAKVYKLFDIFFSQVGMDRLKQHG